MPQFTIRMSPYVIYLRKYVYPYDVTLLAIVYETPIHEVYKIENHFKMKYGNKLSHEERHKMVERRLATIAPFRFRQFC